VRIIGSRRPGRAVGLLAQLSQQKKEESMASEA
jgi:hypothetical protein